MTCRQHRNLPPAHNPEAPTDDLTDHWHEPPPGPPYGMWLSILIVIAVLGMVVYSCSARAQSSFSEVMLIVTIITGKDKPNIQHRIVMPDMETCETELHDFLHHKFPDTVDAKGLAGGCSGKLAEENPS